MTHKEFVKLVQSMRNAQKEYFRIRSYNSLNKSKTLEKDVDAAIQEFFNPDTQTELGL